MKRYRQIDVCRAFAVVCLWSCTTSEGGSPAPPPSLEPRDRFADASADPIEALPRESGGEARKIARGERLFGDSRLSGDDKVACSTCPVVDRGMADGSPRSKAPGRDATRYNSPTIFNVAYSYKFNWTGKFESLEEQLDAPMQN